MITIRCAIYTRKSSEEGLEQDFNSLDAQREACAAYIASQASEGWKLNPERYDDGGLSGGTLERPALQCLLGDVRDGRVDIIVVYKVDRLTRSLLDFSKLVEAFDEAGVSFVSVTQSFNTTTSMGRLTLNMLLSFAQFEREVTAERIRDKIAASKARGMWMGGIAPLGYEPDGRSLAILEDQAGIVRDIYARYRRLGNVRLVARELAAEGVRTPRRITGTGRSFGGRAFSRGQLHAILKNPIYAGLIAHKEKTYPGVHAPIIGRDEWEAVQQQLADNTNGTRRAPNHRNTSLLAGLLFDPAGNPLIPVHTSKGTRRYRYYIRRQEDDPQASSSPLRMPAREVEQLVRRELRQLLTDPLNLLEQAGLLLVPAMLGSLDTRATEISATLLRGGSDTIRQFITRLVVYPDHLVMTLSALAMAKLLGLAIASETSTTFELSVAVTLKRSVMAVRLVHESGAPAGHSEPDPALVRLILKARQWWTQLSQGETDIATLSRRHGVSASWMTRVVRLAFLSPQVTEAILAGQARAGLDAKALLASDAVAADWSQQAALLPV